MLLACWLELAVKRDKGDFSPTVFFLSSLYSSTKTKYLENNIKFSNKVKLVLSHHLFSCDLLLEIDYWKEKANANEFQARLFIEVLLYKCNLTKWSSHAGLLGVA